MQSHRVTRLNETRRLVNNGRSQRWPNTGADVLIKSKQKDEMMEVVNTLLLLTDQQGGEDILNDAMSIVKICCLADRTKSDVTDTQFFPVIIRGRQESEFPIIDAPMALTEAGASACLEAYYRDPAKGLSPAQVTKGFIRSDMNPKDHGHYITINDVPLRKWNPADKQPYATRSDGSELYSGEAVISGIKVREGVIPANSWFGSGADSRWNETHKLLPFTLTSTYLVWFILMTEMKMDSDALRKHGIVPLAAGILFQCIEWTARKGKTTLRKGRDVDPKIMLKQWYDGSPSAIPTWLDDWRQPMKYDYLKAMDFDMSPAKKMGLAEWSLQQVAASVPGDVSLSEIRAEFDDSRIPFIEPDDGPPYMTGAATSTACAMRMFLGYSVALETTGSQHLDHFEEYYREVMIYLASNPWASGKKLAGIVNRVPQMILAHEKQVMLPVLTIPQMGTNGDSCSVITTRDEGLISCIAEDLGVSASLDDIGEVIFNIDKRLGPVLRKIYDRYKEEPLLMFNAQVLDVVTHLSAPGSVEGISRSCKATLGATAYVSYWLRMTKEGINSAVEKNGYILPITAETMEIWQKVLPLLRIPSQAEMKDSMIKLSSAKGAGNDSVAIKTTRKIVLNESLGSARTLNKKQNAKNTKKNMVIAGAGDMVFKPGSLDLVASVNATFKIGLRSVAARLLRLIYQVPLGQQALLYPVYEACGAYMGTQERYALKTATGSPIHKNRDHINFSIRAMREKTMYIIADDASKLDQHKGPRHHGAIKRLLTAKIDSEGQTDVHGYKAKYGKSYYKMLYDVYDSWDNNYFSLVVDKDNDITINLKIDSDPSGAITTAEDNTIIAEAVWRQMQKGTGDSVDGICRLWGDDSYTVTNAVSARDFVEKIRTRERIGKECGQIYETIAGAINGKMVHFLQVLYYGGQIIQRRMPIDHENYTRASLGGIGALIDKYTALAQRGGNLQLCNMLTLSAVIQGVRVKVFGKQAVIDFDTMAAPGGLTNRILMGFPSPNSRLWLSYNWAEMGGTPDAKVGVRPSVERVDKVGARMLMDKSQPVKYTVGTLNGEEPWGERVKKVEEVMMDVDRSTAAYAATTSLTAAGVAPEAPYSEWVERSAEKAMGEAATERLFKKDFVEQALLDAGYIAKTRGGPQATRKMMTVSPPSPVRYGKVHLSFELSNKHTLTVLRSMKRTGVTENIGYKFDVSGLPTTLQFEFRWHPYWSRGMHTKLLLALTGVHASSRTVGIKDLKSAFNADGFRTDMSAEGVIGHIERAKKEGQQFIEPTLRAIGFNNSEIREMTPHIPLIPLYNDVSKANDYVGLEDILQSIDITRIREIIYMTNPSISFEHDPILTRILYTQYLSLLVDEFNVACALTSNLSELVVRLPIPIMT